MAACTLQKHMLQLGHINLQIDMKVREVLQLTWRHAKLKMMS